MITIIRKKRGDIIIPISLKKKSIFNKIVEIDEIKSIIPIDDEETELDRTVSLINNTSIIDIEDN